MSGEGRDAIKNSMGGGEEGINNHATARESLRPRDL